MSCSINEIMKIMNHKRTPVLKFSDANDDAEDTEDGGDDNADDSGDSADSDDPADDGGDGGVEPVDGDNDSANDDDGGDDGGDDFSDTEDTGDGAEGDGGGTDTEDAGDDGDGTDTEDSGDGTEDEEEASLIEPVDLKALRRFKSLKAKDFASIELFTIGCIRALAFVKNKFDSLRESVSSTVGLDKRIVNSAIEICSDWVETISDFEKTIDSKMDEAQQTRTAEFIATSISVLNKLLNTVAKVAKASSGK